METGYVNPGWLAVRACARSGFTSSFDIRGARKNRITSLRGGEFKVPFFYFRFISGPPFQKFDGQVGVRVPEPTNRTG
jgi:hypothetical protein